jgi:hypothetical protein
MAQRGDAVRRFQVGVGATVIFAPPCSFHMENHQWCIQGGVRMTSHHPVRFIWRITNGVYRAV